MKLVKLVSVSSFFVRKYSCLYFHLFTVLHIFGQIVCDINMHMYVINLVRCVFFCHAGMGHPQVTDGGTAFRYGG